MKLFTHCSFPNIFIDVISLNTRVESKFLHVNTVPVSFPKHSFILIQWWSSFNFMGMFQSDIKNSDQNNILS